MTTDPSLSASSSASHTDVERLLMLLDAQKHGLEMTLENAPLAAVLTHLAIAAEELSNRHTVVSILLLDDSGALRTGAAPSLPSDHQQAIDNIQSGPNAGNVAAVIDGIVITREFNAAMWDGLRPLLQTLGLVAAWSMPIKARDGRVLGSFGSYFRESREPLPEEMQAVEILAQTAAVAIERERGESARLASETDFRTMADNIPQLAWIADKNGQPTWLNRRWLEYTGHTMKFLCGEGRLLLMHPDHRDRALPYRAACLASGQTWEDLYPLLGRDGNYRWFLTRVVPVRDARGNIVRWFGTNTDVTDVRDAQDALREADRRKDQFLAVLAHELRNPLTPLVNALEMMHVNPDDRFALYSLHDMMRRQVSHMVRLVDDLMEVSRVSRGKIELRKERIDLRTALQNAIETSRPLIDGAHHRLIIDMPGECIAVDADAVRMTQVFSNLLNNAARYTPDGGEIGVTASVMGERVEISVRDTGKGIDAQHLANVFDWFFQGDRGTDAGASGLGVGLTLARELVQLHDGDIEARSAGAGSGAEFIVRLPLAQQPAQTAAARAKSVAQLPYRILIADDNRDAADSLGMLLRYCGADTEVVYDGRSALEAVERKAPEIAVLDLGMGDIDGYETAERIRAQVKFNDVTLVALTGWNQDDVRARTTAVGFDAHLVKPVDFDTLRNELIRLRANKDRLRSIS